MFALVRSHTVGLWCRVAQLHGAALHLIFFFSIQHPNLRDAHGEALLHHPKIVYFIDGFLPDDLSAACISPRVAQVNQLA